MKDFLIRTAEPGDVKRLALMDEICFSMPWSEKSFFEEVTRNKLARYIVAVASGEIVGYAGLWLIFEEGHITNVAVHPDFRRMGIAKALVAALIEASRTEGAEVYTLEVRASNEKAIALYASFDFKERGVRKGYYEDNGEDAMIMWRTV